MSDKNPSVIPKTIFADVDTAKELIYQPCGFNFSNIKVYTESAEYCACSFSLNEIKVIHRSSKTTPTKIGQFVTLWKRNTLGITEPLNITDDFDIIIITAKTENNFGQFIFSKKILVQNGVISQGAKDGKRGFRVYPPWTVAPNKLAQKTQSWQLPFFLRITEKRNDLEVAKVLLGLK